jgi:predicted glutamine amidotransferase
MCRLFAMSSGRRPMKATFWLLEAPDSLAAQSRRNPDGYGIGYFDDDDTPHVDKRPASAYDDKAFAREARELWSRTFVAHVRYASTGSRKMENTHPFLHQGILFAHNGVVGDLGTLEAELGDYRAIVKGDTDSERVFALVVKEMEAAGGDVEAGLVAAVRWVAGNLPVYAINVVLATASHVWALRYPENHELLILERSAGGPTGGRHLDAASPAGTMRVRSGELGARAAVIVASEQMDEDPGWRGLDVGEMVRIGPDLDVASRLVIDEPPAHPLTLDDLEPHAADSQRTVHELQASR